MKRAFVCTTNIYVRRPAMEAGIASHAWELDEIIALLDVMEETARDVGARRRDRRQ